MKSGSARMTICLLSVTAAVMVLGACTIVAPYEREHVADPIMLIDNEGMSAGYEDHMHRALSQGLKGPPSGDAGCGCEQ